MFYPEKSCYHKFWSGKMGVKNGVKSMKNWVPFEKSVEEKIENFVEPLK